MQSLKRNLTNGNNTIRLKKYHMSPYVPEIKFKSLKLPFPKHKLTKTSSFPLKFQTVSDISLMKLLN